jgi:hypothetical protein
VTRLEILNKIEARDPDGRIQEPTEAERAIFQDWVIRNWGEAMWKDYIAGGWNE